MSTFLAIETATSVCSVAVLQNGNVLASRQTIEGYAHAEKLAVFIQEVCKESGITLTTLDAIVVSGGPGSYTGLRIGVSTAKGICWALDKPLIAIPTLTSMASGARTFVDVTTPYLLCPLIDARRMEVYTAVFNDKGEEIKPVSATIVEQSTFDDLLKNNVVYFFGDGMPKCKSLLSSNSNARFLDDYQMNASHLNQPALNRMKHGDTDHVGLYEPHYFKEFVAGKGSQLPTV
ncbi:MAG: tRNA ((37)-N6)-threonylcarbamoyltransferase complex dimerization subunit type 1 TsaB [Bacteroidota bacterium]